MQPFTRATVLGLSITHVLAAVIQGVHGSSAHQWTLGNNYSLSRGNHGIQVSESGKVIWSAEVPFISASGGRDLVVDSSGAFNLTKVDKDQCQGQEISKIESVEVQDGVGQTGIRIGGSLLDCGSHTASYNLTMWIPADLSNRVAFAIDVAPESNLQKVYLSFSSSANEDFYGLGAQASFASLKNQTVPIFSREQGVGRGDQPVTNYENENGTFSGGDRFTTYTAIPSYISTEGNIFYLTAESTALAFFDFTEPDVVMVRYDALHVSGAFAKANDMFEAVQRLTEYTGRMPALPAWVDEGAVLGIQGGQEKVNGIVEQGLELGCPIAAVWLQDWCGTHSQTGPYINISRLWWNWENDAELYPTWSDFVQNLRSKYGVRTLSYINTFLANVSTKADGFKRNLYDEADSLHYFVQNTTTNSTAIISSGPGLDAGIIDLTNPDLISWFTNVMKTQVWNFANISGYMSDFGEYTPMTPSTKLANANDAFFFHNQYPYLWAEYQRTLVESLGLQDEALIFHRSAAMSANKYMNLFWVGDQNVDWGLNDGIKSVVTIMAHMGFSGYAHQHSDVGGYTDILTYAGFNITRSAELLGRWGELAAVSSAVYRSHEGNIPSVNAQFYSNTSTYQYYAYNARMFVALGPYRRRILETESATKGWPLLRHPVMYHTQDMIARQVQYESFFLGPSLYVAPVLDPQTFELEVYLPGNHCEYIHVWSGVRYSGGQSVNVAAPYGKPAVFLVAGQWVPELEEFMRFVKDENSTEINV